MSKELLRRATPAEQLAELTRGAVDVHTREDLLRKLTTSVDRGIPLRVKMDSTDRARPAPRAHRAARADARVPDFGHTVIFLIGDFTATIGDRPDATTTRPPLSNEQIAANAETYKRQVFKVLDKDRTEVRFNSEWAAAARLAGHDQAGGEYTLARMLERDDFKKRTRRSGPSRCTSCSIRLAQGYDSVALKADVELGSSASCSTCCGAHAAEGVRAGVPGLPDRPAPRGHRRARGEREDRRRQDVQVVGQLRGHRRARGDQYGS